jgi:hypothetical protein
MQKTLTFRVEVECWFEFEKHWKLLLEAGAEKLRGIRDKSNSELTETTEGVDLFCEGTCDRLLDKGGNWAEQVSAEVAPGRMAMAEVDEDKRLDVMETEGSRFAFVEWNEESWVWEDDKEMERSGSGKENKSWREWANDCGGPTEKHSDVITVLVEVE